MIDFDVRKINRRDFLKISALMLAGSFIACRKSEPEKRGGDYPELKNIYPELKDLKVYSLGNFDTPNVIRKYYNFTDSNFNTDIASKYANDMELLAQSGLHFQFRLDSDGITRDVKFIPTNIEIQYLFIVPENAKYPYYFNPRINEGGFLAATSLPDEMNDRVAVTVVKLAEYKDKLNLFNNLKEDVNGALAVEMCQSSMKSQVNGEWDIAMQEIGCNSLGTVYSSRQMGVDYESYQKFIKSVGTISLITFDKYIYDVLPYRGFPINPK